jgi:hypothetical protein
LWSLSLPQHTGVPSVRNPQVCAPPLLMVTKDSSWGGKAWFAIPLQWS